MKHRMKTIYFKILSIILLIMCGCNEFEDFKITEMPFVNKSSVELYVGEGSGNRDQIQLISSPVGKQYTWSSSDPSIATVDQNGLIKAISEGYTIISVSSKNDKAIVNVNVKKYIPLTEFTINTFYIEGMVMDEFQILSTFIPENATDTDIIWTSSNPDVASVSNSGFVRLNSAGSATLTATISGMTKTVEVVVILKIPKSDWSIPGLDLNSNWGNAWYSSQHIGESVGLRGIIDDNLETYWHSSYDPYMVYPHWITIDLGADVAFRSMSMARRTGDRRGQTGFEVLTCTEEDATDPTDPTNWNWVSQGEFPFDSTIDGRQLYGLQNTVTARYVKIYIDGKYRGISDFAMISDFSLYN